MKRALLVLLALAAVALAALLLFLRFSLDGVVARAIERHGSAATGTAVRVEGVEIDLAAGRAAVRGLTVANPEGYSREPAIALREIVVALDTASRSARPIALDEIRIGEPRVRLELREDGGSNLEALRRRLAERARGDAADAEPDAGDPAPPPRLRVARIEIGGGTLHIDPRALGREPVDVALGDVALRQVGGADGATPEALGAVVGRELIDRTLRAAARAEARRALGELGEKMNEWLERSLRR